MFTESNKISWNSFMRRSCPDIALEPCSRHSRIETKIIIRRTIFLLNLNSTAQQSIELFSKWIYEWQKDFLESAIWRCWKMFTNFGRVISYKYKVTNRIVYGTYMCVCRRPWQPKFPLHHHPSGPLFTFGDPPTSLSLYQSKWIDTLQCRGFSSSDLTSTYTK